MMGYAMKISGLFIAFILFIYGNLFTQEPDTLWSKIHSISPQGDIDEGRYVRQTLEGGYIITGSCVPNGLLSHIDLLLLKTDDSGNILWTKTYDRNYIEDGFSVEQTSDGGYIIGGRAVTGVYPVVEPPYSDVWILKTDINGDTLWTRTYGGSENEYCTSIQQTPDMGYIMVGTMNSEYCYPKYEINEEYEPDTSMAWLIKTGPDGDILWTKTYLERSYGNCVTQTSDGGYIIVGWIFPDEQDIQSDVLLIKTDSSGDTVWTKIIGEEDYDAGFCVRQTADGYVIVGQTKPKGSPYDALLIKTDLSGEVLWIKKFGGERSDACFSVEASHDGFFITGTTNGNWWVHTGDMWVFETDSNGNLLWEKIYDIRLSDFAFNGIQTSDDSYVVTGMTSTGFGGDLWLAKLGWVPTSIDNNHSGISGFFLYQNYPNPFNPSTTIAFDLPKTSKVTLKIFNILGEEVTTLVSDRLSAGSYTYEWSRPVGMASGVYFYRLDTDQYVQTRKMILMR